MLFQERSESFPRRLRSHRARYEFHRKQRPFVDLNSRAEIIAVTAEWLACQVTRSVH